MFVERKQVGQRKENLARKYNVRIDGFISPLFFPVDSDYKSSVIDFLWKEGNYCRASFAHKKFIGMQNLSERAKGR